MGSQFKEEKDIIVYCEENDRWLEGIQRCNVLLSKVKKSKELKTNCIEYKKEIYFCYYMLAKLYKNQYGLSKLNIAIEYAQKAFKYNYNQMEYMRSLWLLAEFNILINKTEKAIKIYKRCSQYYYNHNLHQHYLMVLFNIAKLSKRTNLMSLIIEKYKNQYNQDNKTIDSMNVELSETYVELFESYLVANSNVARQKAMALLHKINDKSLVKLLCKKLLVA